MANQFTTKLEDLEDEIEDTPIYGQVPYFYPKLLCLGIHHSVVQNREFFAIGNRNCLGSLELKSNREIKGFIADTDNREEVRYRHCLTDEPVSSINNQEYAISSSGSLQPDIGTLLSSVIIHQLDPSMQVHDSASCLDQSSAPYH